MDVCVCPHIYTHTHMYVQYTRTGSTLFEKLRHTVLLYRAPR